MKDRSRARELASQSVGAGDPFGWFERLYSEADAGDAVIPWADLVPNPNLTSLMELCPVLREAKSCLKVGSGYGDDVAYLENLGIRTIGIDIAPTAIARSRERFPELADRFFAGDIRAPEGAWNTEFPLVVESYTLQVVPADFRPGLYDAIMERVSPGGFLAVITRSRGENDGIGAMPWPLTAREARRPIEKGFDEVYFEAYTDRETPPVERIRAVFRKR